MKLQGAAIGSLGPDTAHPARDGLADRAAVLPLMRGR